MFIKILLTLCFSTSLIVSVSSNESCTLKNGEAGVCKIVYDCPYILNQEKQFNKEPEYCGDSDDEIVCCAESPVKNTFQNRCLNYIKYAFERVPSFSGDPASDLVTYDYAKRCFIPHVEFSIVGGMDAKDGEFPHMAAIGDNVVNPTTVVWICGGSLISENYVLTAAHCLNVPVAEKTLRPTIIKLGGHDFDREKDTNEQLIEVKNAIAHPEYRKENVYHDIALLELKKPAELNPYVRPACLPYSTTVHDKAITIGWGKEVVSLYNGVLQKLDIPFVRKDKCEVIFNPNRAGRVPQGVIKELFCYGALEGKDACPGSSGGPLSVINDDVFCSYTVVGVTSAGFNCTQGYPGLYTNVLEYNDWIEKIVWK